MLISLNSRVYRALIDELIRMRHAAGLTQRDFAKKVKRSPGWVSKLETYDKYIDIFELAPIVRALGGDPAKVYETFCVG